ncbi:MAG: SDR family NAD(P)-dependent oxidoreductase [Minwuia sp.]|nr:SDR family NAD(P)-dependent oxidoreductase [Minwuia sp.]
MSGLDIIRRKDTSRTDIKRALIVGAGPGISASLARKLSNRGIQVMLASRSTDKLSGLASEIGARTVTCDAGDASSVSALFDAVDRDMGGVDLVLYNPSMPSRGPLLEQDPAQVEEALRITCLGGFLVAQAAVRRMAAQGHGKLFFTGASASVKGYARSAPFAMGKFRLRGLAQSVAREFGPEGVHVAHFVIDGGVRSDTRPGRQDSAGNRDALLDPDAVADTYLATMDQPRSAWSMEVELRPWVERF